MPSDALGIFFLAIVFLLYFSLIFGFRYSLSKQKEVPDILRAKVLVFRMSLGAWIVLVSFLAVQGFFMDFLSLPPKIMFAIVPALGLTLYLGFSKRVDPVLKIVPAAWIIGLQSFRILVEIVLWQLALRGLLPPEMSFEGRNFDILVGLTTPIVAFFVYTGKVGPKFIKVWNILGILILTNIVLHGLLAAPTQFQVFKFSPSNSIIGTFPYILLPVFVVPVAYFLHILSLRQLKQMTAGILCCFVFWPAQADIQQGGGYGVRSTPLLPLSSVAMELKPLPRPRCFHMTMEGTRIKKRWRKEKPSAETIAQSQKETSCASHSEARMLRAIWQANLQYKAAALKTEKVTFVLPIPTWKIEVESQQSSLAFDAQGIAKLKVALNGKNVQTDFRRANSGDVLGEFVWETVLKKGTNELSVSYVFGGDYLDDLESASPGGAWFLQRDAGAQGSLVPAAQLRFAPLVSEGWANVPRDSFLEVHLPSHLKSIHIASVFPENGCFDENFVRFALPDLRQLRLTFPYELRMTNPDKLNNLRAISERRFTNESEFNSWLKNVVRAGRLTCRTHTFTGCVESCR